MKRYQSYKVVEAAPIFAINPKAVIVDNGHDKEGETIRVPENFFARGTPAPGDYLVRYEPDGYLSWSPKDKFEAGYVAID